MHRAFSFIVLSVLAITACTPAGPAGGGAGSAQPEPPRGPKIIVAAINEDPKNMWDGINGGGGSGARELGHMLNQYLANLGPDGTPVPRLLAELPAQDKGTWKVTPDGKMEVTYKIRPGVTWHDGKPFTAEDIAFSWEVGKDPAVPSGNQSAMRLVSGVRVIDASTAIMDWSSTYAFADRLEHREFYPLPKHLMEQAYRDSKETLIAQPFFSREFVGVGPYKLTAWEPGSHMELVANDSYFLGRPKIDRIRIAFISDTNVGVANLRAGTIHTFLPSGGPDWDKLESLQKEWRANGAGDVVIERVRWMFMEPQKGPLAAPTDLKDVRFRQALLLATNRQELTDSLQGEFGGVAHSWVHPSFGYYPQVKEAITEYPYDVRRAQAVLTELGWTAGGDGILQKGGSPLKLVLRPEEVRVKEAAILQQEWKKIGMDVSIEVGSNELLRDAEARANFSGVAINQNPMGGLSAVRRFAGDQTPTAANRFAGTNRGQFVNPAWDDVGSRLRTALDDKSRIDLEKELLRVFSGELPALPLQYELQALPVTGFKGFMPVTGSAHTGNIMHTTNVHEWDI